MKEEHKIRIIVSDNSRVITPEHECEENICEKCFVNECLNCGASCYCDL